MQYCDNCEGCYEAERDEAEWRDANVELAEADTASRILWAR